MENFTTKTIREIPVAAPATTRVFEEYKIDFCCLPGIFLMILGCLLISLTGQAVLNFVGIP